MNGKSVVTLREDVYSALIAERNRLAREADAAVARAEAAESWLDELAQAAGMGPVAIVAAHQRELGVGGDHEPRLRAKQVRRLKAIVMEEAEWRRQVLAETQARAEAAELAVATLTNELEAANAECRNLRRALDGTP